MIKYSVTDCVGKHHYQENKNISFILNLIGCYKMSKQWDLNCYGQNFIIIFDNPQRYRVPKILKFMIEISVDVS